MNYITERPEWVSFYPKFSSAFYISKAGYFDERPEITTSMTQILALISIPFLVAQSAWLLLLTPLILFGWGTLYIHLPIKTGIQDCESAAWGLNYHNDTFWIYIGGGGNVDGGRKWITYYMPWSFEWVRTSTKLNTGDWFHETKGNQKSWAADPEGMIEGSYDWLKKNKWQETHPFVDKYDGTTVNATISITEREWRPRAFKWTSLFARVQRSLEISFDKEVGKGKGSYKGGTVGCGYELRPNETPLECLKRMEQDRTF